RVRLLGMGMAYSALQQDEDMLFLVTLSVVEGRSPLSHRERGWGRGKPSSFGGGPQKRGWRTALTRSSRLSCFRASSFRFFRISDLDLRFLYSRRSGVGGQR